MNKTKPRKKTLLFHVRLKHVDPKSRKKLMAMGMDRHLTLYTREITFTDTGGKGFKCPLFAMAVEEQKPEVLAAAVDCVVEEKKPPRGRAKR